jgi:hypothetical protein
VSESVVSRAQRARRNYWCDDVSFGHDRKINPGDVYVRTVAFPGHDANPDGPAPLVMKLCAYCAATYPNSAAALNAYGSKR